MSEGVYNAKIKTHVKKDIKYFLLLLLLLQLLPLLLQCLTIYNL